MIRKIKYALTDMCIVLFRALLGVNKKRVFFMCFGGKSYADNTRAVSESLHELYPQIKIVWIFNDPDSKKEVIPKYIKTVKNTRLNFFFNLAISGCIVSNNGFFNFKKSKKQYLIQLWHGDRGFKKILYDCWPENSEKFCPESFPGFCDLAVAGSKYGEMQFRSAFRYKGEVLMEGIPRNDVLINIDQERVVDVKNKLGISSDKKIFLYAPTLRKANANNHSLQQKQNISLERTLDVLKNKTNQEWICIVRAHPAMLGLAGISFNENIIDVSKYDDMADLLLISDLLVTDYSSSAGDFALLHRPIILFQSDRQEYLERDRSLYFNMEDSPYFVVENQEQLETMIKELEDEKAVKNCDDILRFYGTCETGKVSKTLAHRIGDRALKG